MMHGVGRVRGIVAAWNDDEGWGLLESADVPALVWAHCSMVHIDGLGGIRSGQRVEFTWEKARDGGYHYRAVDVWPVNGEAES